MISPKQLAYLTYLGLKRVDGLTEDAANRRIEILHKKAKGFCGRKLRSKIVAWDLERLVLHPQLYRNELLLHLLRDDSRFRSFVRTRHVNCSSTLTASKIEKVFKLLLDEKPGWWLKQDDTVVFYQRLARVFPECVDGPVPQKNQKSKQTGAKGGCFSVLVFGGLVTLILKALFSATFDS